MRKIKKDFNTIEDFIKFMESSNLQTIFDLRNKYYYIFSRYLILKITNKIIIYVPLILKHLENFA